MSCSYKVNQAKNIIKYADVVVSAGSIQHSAGIVPASGATSLQISSKTVPTASASVTFSSNSVDTNVTKYGSLAGPTYS